MCFFVGLREDDGATFTTFVGASDGKPLDVQLPTGWVGTGAGRGFAAYTILQERWADQLSNIELTLLPRAHEVVLLAAEEVRAGRTQPPEDAVPTYIRDDVAKPKGP